ncbi:MULTISPECIES: tyrosine-type recombinase/integrase [Carnobacterium]|uniref:tyrosine-type recombinase/integrase n=1 Tax=Carnobacterium TaxID=2747 RepID=UPI0035DEAFA4
MKYLSFHKLRHSSASYLISVGKHAEVVQQVLGHKDIRTTMNIYAHVFDEQKEDVASSFESFNSK